MLYMRLAHGYLSFVQQQLPLPGASGSTIGSDTPFWFGSTDWQVDDGWATPLRLGRADGLSERLRAAAQCAAGVRAEFDTDASAVTLPIRGADGDARQVVDLVVDGRLVERAEVERTGVERAGGERAGGDDRGLLTFALPGRLSRVEIWLPQRGNCQIGGLRLRDVTTVTAPPRRPRWIAYGSSITQCSAADGPSSTWPALVARRLGWDLTCLGFNGLAHLDLPVAGVIAAAQPDVVTVCAGINIYNQATFTADELAQRLREFVAIIRGVGEHHDPIALRPVTIALMSPITSPDREARRNSLDLTLQDVRRTVERIADQLPGVSTIAGPDLFGSGDADLLSDGLHPTAAGYRLMADRITPLLAELTDPPSAVSTPSDRGAASDAQGVLHQPPTIVQQ
jgi:lysophospholipase L1-like esterase